MLPNIEGLSAEQAAAVVKLSRGLANSSDMEDRLKFYDLAKKVDPKISIPADVQMEQFRREQKNASEQREIQDRVREHSTRQERQRQALIDSGRYTDDVVKKIENEIMIPKGIADYDSAATLYAAANPPENIPNQDRQTGATWEMPWAKNADKNQVSELIANPRKAALNKAHAVVAELKRKRSA